MRLEVCYPLHGNDISPERTPIEAGLGWACALDKDFTGVDVLRRQKEEGPSEKLVAFVMEDPGIPRAGMRIAEGGEVTSGTLSPMLGRASGSPTSRPGAREPGTEITVDLRGRPRARAYRQEAVLQARGGLVAAEESYPDDLKYHPEHDWARIEGDTATLGITWYAQDALGEIVHYEPPEEGSALARDESYGEVESVKAVSDIIAPLSGEVAEVNRKVVDEPETINEDPVRRGLARADPALRCRARCDELLDVEAYRELLAEQ